MEQRHPPQEWIAAVVMVVVLALMALDILDDSFNTWFDQHSFTTDAASTLLGLAVAALVVDRITDRRRLRDRAQVMAAQGTMIAAQGLRTNQAVARALDGNGDREAAEDELRTYLTMMLNGAGADRRATDPRVPGDEPASGGGASPCVGRDPFRRSSR